MPIWTIQKIREQKGKVPITVVTAYDAITGHIAESAEVMIVLVGDSLGTTALGYSSTIPVTIDMMTHHTVAVRRCVSNALLVADLPFLSYQISDSEILRNTGRLIQEGGADAVKLEGGKEQANAIRLITQNGIPVMAHIGLMPQSVKASGYAVKGRTEESVKRLKDDIIAVSEAGAFAVVLECVVGELAAELTKISPIPTIGIGSGVNCDGQVLVMADLLGLNHNRIPSFVKQYANCGEIAINAVKSYVAEVQSKTYPSDKYTF